jgi:hypothetical protein
VLLSLEAWLGQQGVELVTITVWIRSGVVINGGLDASLEVGCQLSLVGCYTVDPWRPSGSGTEFELGIKVLGASFLVDITTFESSSTYQISRYLHSLLLSLRLLKGVYPS